MNRKVKCIVSVGSASGDGGWEVEVNERSGVMGV